MVESTSALGLMEDSMAKEFLQTRMVKTKKDRGKMVNNLELSERQEGELNNIHSKRTNDCSINTEFSKTSL